MGRLFFTVSLLLYLQRPYGNHFRENRNKREMIGGLTELRNFWICWIKYKIPKYLKILLHYFLGYLGISYLLLNCLYFPDDFHSFPDSLFIFRNEVMVTFGQCLV